MTVIDPAFLAAQLAARLDRPLNEDRPALFYQVRQGTLRIVSSEKTPGGMRVRFEFEGEVIHGQDPLGYLARGSVEVDAQGRIRPETLVF